MQLAIIDAFADRPFTGNPAAVCLHDQELDPEWMQALAVEMNYSETAFVRPIDRGFQLRWFTPAVEVELCGHATLASAHLLWTEGIAHPAEVIRFHTKSGELCCRRNGQIIELDFPATPAVETDPPAGLLEALGVNPSFVGQSKFDRFVVVDSEQVIRSLTPDFARLREIPMRGVIVTSEMEGDEFDFVSRYFAPGAGVDEDPVTGSAHCCLAPFWSERLGKSELIGFQASARGGTVRTRVKADRVILGGQAITVMTGHLTIPSALRTADRNQVSDLICRHADQDDAALLARMNRQLIDDEGSPNPMSVAELEQRMLNWLVSDLQAVVIERAGEPAGYLLFQVRSDEYQPEQQHVYLRQFLIVREQRGQGIGRQAFEIAADRYFPAGVSVVLDVLPANRIGYQFWRSLGFRDCLTTMKLERVPLSRQ